MKKTLQKVTAEDLRPLLNKIDTPTDLFWGTEDTMTPYKDALIMEREINGSTLHTFKGVRHKVQKERPDEIAEVIRKLVV